MHVTLVHWLALVCIHGPQDLRPSLGPRLTAGPHNFIESAAILSRDPGALRPSGPSPLVHP